ncbi:hypothetical protein C8Q74DRAFT_1354864 [Fomes fomentarius]|nr:hypothetical protein C8Q74DRAFT_1354864 [Fomes fomentarius]
MHHKNFVLPFGQFMEYFIPEPEEEPSHGKTLHPDIFNGMPKPETEVEMYRNIPKRLNKSDPPCVNFVVIATPHKGDQSIKSTLAPDMGVYPKKGAPKRDPKTRFAATDWSTLEIPIEAKTSINADPFSSKDPDGVPDSEERKKTFGQILSYSELLFQNQHRNFHFLVLFLGHFSRIVRIDRSGIFATERFNYVNDPDNKLPTFLRKYSELSRKQRGHDPTVERVKPGLAKRMRDTLTAAQKAAAASGDGDNHVLKLFGDSLKDDYPWWKLQVHDEITGKIMSYAVAKPHFQAPGVRGRGTRGYVALPINSNGTLGDKFVYLKDAWRVKHEAIAKEGATLKYLNDNEILYVPTLLCHGDLPGQVTQAPDVWKDLHPGEVCPLKDHQHYRIVVKEVCKPLSEVECGSQLFKALYHCTRAHQAAYNVGIIHRDISAGNILLYKNEKGIWKGMLTDWELAKDITKTKEVRQPERTGTWQFMSALVQDDPSRVVVVADELESLLHVFIFYGIRFLPHNLLDANVPQFIHDYFDDFSAHIRGTRSSLVKRNAVKMGKIELTSYTDNPTAMKGTTLQFVWPSKGSSTEDAIPDVLDFNHPLNDFVTQLLSWFRAHYIVNERLSDASATVPDGNIVTGRDDANVPGLDEDDIPSIPQHVKSNEVPPCSYAYSRKKQPDEETIMLARKLHTHESMLALMVSTLHKPWPRDDKTPDKGPKDALRKNKDVLSDLWEPPEHFLGDMADADELEAMEVQDLLDTVSDDEAETETEYATDDEEAEENDEAEEDDEAEEEEVEETLFDITNSDDNFALPQPAPSRPSTPLDLIEYCKKRPLEEPRTPLNKRSRS